jgi:hypothetical protein
LAFGDSLLPAVSARLTPATVTAVMTAIAAAVRIQLIPSLLDRALHPIPAA